MTRKENKKKLLSNEPTKFYTYRKVAELTGRNIRTVYNKVYGIREEINTGRYSPLSLPDGLINWYVYLDYLKWEKDLKDKYRRKTVPPFSAYEYAKLEGIAI